MPRIRSIKPEFFTSEDVACLPFRARLTWVGLWLHCDDHGRHKDKVKLIKAEVWPLDDDVSLSDVAEDLDTLAAEGRIVRYEVEGDRYLAVVNWHFHQSINRPGRPKYPAPPVPMKSPEAGEVGHCSGCFGLYVAHRALTEPSPGDNSVDNFLEGVYAGQGANIRSISESSVNAHGVLTAGREREREKEREGRGGETRASAPQPPPPRCPRHLDNPTTDPCGGCGNARRAREQFDRAHEQAQRAALNACTHCDGDGWRWHPDGKRHGVTGERCDHTPAAHLAAS